MNLSLNQNFSPLLTGFPICVSQRFQSPQEVHAFSPDFFWRRDYNLFPLPPYCAPQVLPMDSGSRPLDQSYPSPASSLPSPGQRTNAPHDAQAQGSNYPSPMGPGTPGDIATSTFPQIHSSIGPTRPTRRQHVNVPNQGHRRASITSVLSAGEKDYHSRQHSEPYYTSQNGRSRQHTPARSSDHPHIEYNVAGPSSSTYSYPPVSQLASPPYEPYRSHSRVASSSRFPYDTRPTSPASSISSNYSSSSVSSITSPAVAPDATASSVIKGKAKHRKTKLDDQARKAICEYKLIHPSARQHDIAKEFNVERSTVSKILKQSEKWLKVDITNARTSKHRPSKFPEIEREMVKILRDCTEKKFAMSDKFLGDKALEIASKLGITEDRFKASSGWIDNFKSRHGVSGNVWHGYKAFEAKKPQASSPSPSKFPSFILSPVSKAKKPEDDMDVSSTNNSSGSQNDELDSDDQVYSRRPRYSGDVRYRDWHPRNDLPSIQQAIMQSSLQDPSPTSSHFSPSQYQRERPLTYESQYSGPATYSSTSYQNSVTYDPSFSSESEEALPSLSEAEDALNKVLLYLDTKGRDMIGAADRNVLHNLKCTMFQAGSGIPFNR